MTAFKHAQKRDEHHHHHQHKSAWFQFLKSIATFKGDLTSITAPPFLLAPQSIVEFTTYWAEHPSLFVAPATEESAEKRALLVLQWFLSTLKHQHATKDDNGKRKKLKPLNPFLGEIFLGKWVDDVGTTKLVSEQVSHHPPATAYRIWNDRYGVQLEGHVAPKAYFSTTINIERKGYSTLHIDQFNEDHLITMPNAHVEGIATFRIAPELSGTSYIRSSSGYTSRIDYSSKGWFKGESNSFVATLYRGDDEPNVLYVLEGTWSGFYTMKDKRGKVLQTVDLTALRRTPLQVAPIEEQHPLESRRAWQHVANAINENDFLAVGQEKSKIENQQRALRKEENAAGRVWERRYFTRVTEDPVAVTILKTAGNAVNLGTDDMLWKFDMDKYRKTIRGAEWMKSPLDRSDSGVALTDEDDADRVQV
ncbi:hypothetical protein DL762_000922 [Monosporascus cannonballus]|uniref:Oxysterol-binding protein n=1 Tax=Monosporascus cannonballus TaxID=155416 RepID=A0ABY0HHP7_9PEZI|nr:hypothetical protein DL762_000922 [Monosporascus cannonballus]